MNSNAFALLVATASFGLLSTKLCGKQSALSAFAVGTLAGVTARRIHQNANAEDRNELEAIAVPGTVGAITYSAIQHVPGKGLLTPLVSQCGTATLVSATTLGTALYQNWKKYPGPLLPISSITPPAGALPG